MKVCTVEGCERRYHAKGMCNVHLERVKRTGSTELPVGPSLNERIEARIRREVNGCWVWTGSATPAGYGLLSVDGTLLLAHRLVYERTVREIPAGMHIDHLCRNPPCVNPKHLDVVTPRENVVRGMSPTAVIHRQGVCRRGHLLAGDNVYVPPRKPTQRRCRACKEVRRSEIRATGRRAT